jgi:hypothetical protein
MPLKPGNGCCAFSALADMQPPHFKFKAAVGVPAVTDKAQRLASGTAGGEVWLALAMQVARSA